MAGCLPEKSSTKLEMKRWADAVLLWAEVAVSSLIHTLFGFSLLSSALASEISKTLRGILKPSSPAMAESQGVGDGRPPVVMIHGMFGFGEGKMGGLSYFGGAEKRDERVLVPDLGSLTSIHDRARRLFYYLKGGRVDYGEEHSKAAGHSQFGTVYEHGHYPEWDEEHPLQFVTHSAGSQVVRVLQQMLADKAFEGYENTSEDWVLSLTCISGPLNGTTRAYMDGVGAGDWRCVKPVCMVQVCRLAICIYDWLDIGWMKRFYNFGFDHFELSWRKVGVWGLVECLMGHAGPTATGDWVLPDLTLQGTAATNARTATFPNTFYFSYASRKTRRISGVTVPCMPPGMHPALLLRSWQMCRWRHPEEAEPPYKGYRDEDWEENDGAVNTFSMTHPRIPREHPSCEVSDDGYWERETVKAGMWYYRVVEADHLMFVVNRERAGVEFDLLYDAIFERCRKLGQGKKTRSAVQ